MAALGRRTSVLEAGGFYLYRLKRHTGRRMMGERIATDTRLSMKLQPIWGTCTCWHRTGAWAARTKGSVRSRSSASVLRRARISPMADSLGGTARSVAKLRRRRVPGADAAGARLHQFLYTQGISSSCHGEVPTPIPSPSPRY